MAKRRATTADDENGVEWVSFSGIAPEADIAKVLGEVLANGTSRIVYAVRGDDSVVVKEGRQHPYAANQTEWKVWNEIAGSEIGRSFAECFAISTTGQYLVMERLETDIGGASRPATPTWLTDRKVSCLGIAADGIVKVLDYGQVNEPDGEWSKAPLHPWPSSSASKSMRDIMRALGDDPLGFGDG